MEQPESSEDEDGEEAQISQDLRGYRLIDVDILKRNILSQLSCTFCHSEVNLLSCVKTRTVTDNRHFPQSCPIIPAGNVSVYSVSRRSAFAMRCISRDRAVL